ncbi:hypothetical protein [Thermogemmatispora sp.]|nr:hypothetical protein [Thermogemmatispora sp.]
METASLLRFVGGRQAVERIVGRQTGRQRSNVQPRNAGLQSIGG